MPLTDLDPAAGLGLARGQVAVCIPVFGAADQFAQCVRSVLAHTPLDVPVLVADDASPDPAIRTFLAELDAAGVLTHAVSYLRQPANLGFVGNMNAAFRVLTPADVIILNSDCVVADGWFGRLCGAAATDSRVATVSTLTNHGTILTVPNRNRPAPGLPQDWTIDSAAAAVAAGSLRLRPEIPTGVGHCLYIRRAALDLVGDFDLAFSPGYGEEVDFSQRCVLHGLCHIVADDVLVLHRGGSSFTPGGGVSETQRRHDRIIGARYPYYEDWVERTAQDRSGPLARSLGAAGRTLTGLSVTIDGRCLTRYVTGTQVHTLEVIAAVHRTGDARLRVVVPPELGDYARDLLAAMPDVEQIVESDISEHMVRTDIVHRPWQIGTVEDLTVLAMTAHRVVITHQDLIAFHNPGYFNTFERWDDYQRLTRLALAAADRVLFFSRHAADDALGAELVTADRSQVVHIGTDHQLQGLAPEPVMPRGAEVIGDRPFLVCLGTDYRHKNRAFAIRVLEELRRDQGWPGMLVFVGAHVDRGSSAGEEAEILARRPELADVVIDLAAVDEAGKAWAMRHARAVLYPSAFEGFGLVPFEAAEAGIPCLFASQTSVAELLPTDLAAVVPWDPVATAAACAPLLAEGTERERHVAAVRAEGARLTWERTATELVAAYRTAAAVPAREATRLVAENLTIAEDAEDLDRRLAMMYERLDHDAMALVGPYGVLPRDLIRPLLAISRHAWLRIPILGSLRLFYRLAYLLRHGRLPAPPEPRPFPRHEDSEAAVHPLMVEDDDEGD